MRNRLIILPLLVLFGCTPQENTQALGSLERDRISLTATANEIIEQIDVQEGQAVHQGDVLLTLSSISQRAVLAKAVAQEVQAQTQLTKLLNGERSEDVASAKANVENARVRFDNEEKQYRRIAELVARKLSSPAEKDNALAKRDEARASYNAALQTLKKLSAGYRAEDIEVARAELAAAKASVELEQHKLSELTITATRDGVIDSLPYHQGERVPVNGIVAIIAAESKPYARVYLPELQVAHYPVGTQVTVHVDGVDKPMMGKVRWISKDSSFTTYRSMSARDRSRLVYLTKIDLPDSAVSLPAGIPVQVDLDDDYE